MSQSEFQVRETTHLSIAQLAEATNATFADYFTPITHTADGFAAFCRVNGMDLAQSVLLERRSDARLAGLAMLALRGAEGWCGGFGVTPEFRGRGLSAVLVAALVDAARRQGLATLRLEVLTQNTRAIKTYTRVGFQTGRDLVILAGPLDAGADTAPPDLEVHPAASPLAAWMLGLELSTPAPCWQREPVSLLTMGEMEGLVATHAGQTVGVLLFRPNRAAGLLWVGFLGFTDDAVARALLVRAAAQTGLTQLFVHNEPEGSPLHALCRTLGLRELHRQHEMILTLK